MILGVYFEVLGAAPLKHYAGTDDERLWLKYAFLDYSPSDEPNNWTNQSKCYTLLEEQKRT